MILASPYALLLFVPFLFMCYRMLRRHRATAFSFPGVGQIIRKKSLKQRFALIPSLLFMLGAASLIIALARPQKQLARTQISSEAIAIEMSIDTSGSMLALDFSEKGIEKTRLDVVKETFKEFVEKRPTDLIGLVTFGGYATALTPLTLDHKALTSIIDEVHVPGTQKSDGVVDEMETATAVGDGLAMACARLEKQTNIASRVVILLSDGVTNTGIVTPEQATDIAKQMGIKVYTIGVGSTGRANVRGVDVFGRSVVGTMYVSMDEPALKKIASETGGNYYNVRDKKALENALARIDELEKTEIDQQIYLRSKEYFVPFLVAGFILCFIACLFPAQLHRGVV
jgi:Ca-activated chloride channel family protein